MNFCECEVGMEVKSIHHGDNIVYKILYLNECGKTVDVEVVRSEISTSNGNKYHEIDPAILYPVVDPKALYIGNSLSFCLQDILAGKMDEDRVVCIISSVHSNRIDVVFENNYSTYWRQFDKEKAEMLLYRLWPRIVQPRQWGMFFNIANQPRWIKAHFTRGLH